MDARRFIVILAIGSMAGGCAGDPGNGVPPSADTAATKPSPAPPTESAAAPLDSADAAGPAGAVAVVREYYAAVAAGDYARAYALWSGGGEASGQTFEEFRRGYEDTRSVSVTTGEPGRIEGAAGSRFIEVPVTISAETSAGEQQCFHGSYALRRSEVPGATAEQRAWRIHSASLSAVPAAECAPSGATSAADSAAAVIRSFGEALAMVSVLAPADIVRRDVRAHYAPHVTPELLASWLDAPAAAPGREVSSPWPERIEIRSMEAAGDGRMIARGTVIYVTSTEAGTADAADERQVEIEVVRTADGWRIASFDLAER